MKKFDGILICTDLDGTLLRNDKSVSKENLDAIEYFKAEGGMFTIVTGRMPVTAIDICDVVKPNVPIGCINGGGIFDPQAERLLWMASVDRSALELVEAVDKNMPDIGIQVNTAKTVYFCKYNQAMINFRKEINTPDIRCHYTEINEPIAKIIFTEDDEKVLFELIDLLNNHPKAKNFDFIRSQRTLYELLPKGVTKGTSLTKLTEILGVDIKKTVAIGDFDNDVELIRCAGVGYAVSNACNAAKAVADRITVSNEEHAIAKVIDDIDSGKLIF